MDDFIPAGGPVTMTEWLRARPVHRQKVADAIVMARRIPLGKVAAALQLTAAEEGYILDVQEAITYLKDRR